MLDLRVHEKQLSKFAKSSFPIFQAVADLAGLRNRHSGKLPEQSAGYELVGPDLMGSWLP
jgi:hypothetical protein